jgi:hypothetical protein
MAKGSGIVLNTTANIRAEIEIGADKVINGPSRASDRNCFLSVPLA